ncbi:hypothetical protein GCM10009651_33850 [Microbacterium natoriense]
MRPMRTGSEGREGAAAAGESVVIVENSFGWRRETQSHEPQDACQYAFSHHTQGRGPQGLT